MPQGSVLRPLLFSFYINNMCFNLSNVTCHFCADDTVMYCCSASLAHALSFYSLLLTVTVQLQLQSLNLVLNAETLDYCDVVLDCVIEMPSVPEHCLPLCREVCLWL